MEQKGIDIVNFILSFIVKTLFIIIILINVTYLIVMISSLTIEGFKIYSCQIITENGSQYNDTIKVLDEQYDILDIVKSSLIMITTTIIMMIIIIMLKEAIERT